MPRWSTAITYSRIETSNLFYGALDSARTCGPVSFDYMINNGAPEEVCEGGTNLLHAARLVT